MKNVLKLYCTKENVESACCIIRRRPGPIPNLMLFYYIILCVTLGKSADGPVTGKATKLCRLPFITGQTNCLHVDSNCSSGLEEVGD